MSTEERKAERATNPWRLLLSWSALLWERAWPALWPAAGIAGLFLMLGLLDVLPFFPGWLHLVVLAIRSEEHTSELQSLMRNSYAVFCLKQKKQIVKHDIYYK